MNQRINNEAIVIGDERLEQIFSFSETGEIWRQIRRTPKFRKLSSQEVTQMQRELIDDAAKALSSKAGNYSFLEVMNEKMEKLKEQLS